MGGACCVKNEIIPDDYINSVFNSLKLKRYSFQVFYSKIINKEFNSKNLVKIFTENSKFIDFIKITESTFYDLSNTDDIHDSLHKKLFDKLVKFYTKSNGDISVIDIFSLFLLLLDNTNMQKVNFFYEMHVHDLENISKLKNLLLTYLKDCIFLLTNICVEYYEYENTDILYNYLRSYTSKKVELYFENLHKDLVSLDMEKDKVIQVLNELNFIFNFNQLRQSYQSYFKDDRSGEVTPESIKTELENYSKIRKKDFR